MIQRLYKKSLGKIVRADLKWLDFYNCSAFLLKFTKVLLKLKGLDSVGVSSAVGTVVISRI